MLIQCDDKEVRKAAIYQLGKLASPEALNKILEFIKSEDKDLKNQLF